jgi:hypothetical protein
MTRRKLLWIKRIALCLGSGVIFGGLSCVTTAADLVGTGLSLTAATGLLGGATQGATAVGSGLDWFADLVKFTPIGG